MVGTCKLCGRRTRSRGASDVCTCGWRLDPDCREVHEPWCPVEGDERWIGAHEI